MSSTSNPRVQLIDSQGDPMDSPDDNALKVKLVDTDVEITVVAENLSVVLAYDSDSVTAHQGGSPWQVQSNSANLATVAKQPALGTAGSASSDVITVQGVASMTPLLATVGHNITTIASDEMDVIAAGTAQVLSVSQACKKVDIQAKITNTGKIYIGGSTVDSDEGLELRRGDIYSLEIGDLNNVYVDSSVDGEGVRYTWYG